MSPAARPEANTQRHTAKQGPASGEEAGPGQREPRAAAVSPEGRPPGVGSPFQMGLPAA
ncbi:hypothetical protein BX257_1578 [Streptomyces sp. 3212.3]|nr:hypothetical protein BX257_1578 [Streptomyces sp. 3212.3]